MILFNEGYEPLVTYAVSFRKDEHLAFLRNK